MNHDAVNRVIDRIVRDGAFAAEVLAKGESALQGYGLTPDQSRAIAAALDRDARPSEGAEPFASLRTLVRFEPLFASYSASATKKG